MLAEGQCEAMTKARMMREHRELLAALKWLVEKCVDSEYWIWSETSIGEPFQESKAVAQARALIARIEKP